MNLNTKKYQLIKKEELIKYIGKKITIVSHTKANFEGLQAAWHKVPQEVKLLEFNKSENLIKIDSKGNIFTINLVTLDEIHE